MERKELHIILLVVSLLFCPLFLRAEVYTIDFNRGTVNGIGGGGINTLIQKDTDPIVFCNFGSEYVTLNGSYNKKCYYNDKGCGIRIGANDGEGWFTLTLGDVAVYVSKIIVYASKLSGNTTSTLTIVGGSVFSETISNSELKDYSSSSPASVNYSLSEVVVNSSFKNLQFKAPREGYVYLHRIDIIFSEDALSLPFQSAGTNYATFSNDKATFFPVGSTVSKVSVIDGRLNVTALDTEYGFGTSGCYVPANTGVLVSSISSDANYLVLEGVTLESLDDNMLKPASEPMTGSDKYYKLAYDDYTNKTGLGFYWGAADGGMFSCEAGTAYLAVGSGSVKGYVLDGASDEDVIKALKPNVSSGKEDVYNVTGQQVHLPLQGIYIKGGRKYVVR